MHGLFASFGDTCGIKREAHVVVEWQARAWLGRLNSEGLTVSQLAEELDIDDGEISRVLPLAFLAPDIVRSIVEGRHPPELTTRRLKRLKPLPALWQDQRQALNFPAQN